MDKEQEVTETPRAFNVGIRSVSSDFKVQVEWMDDSRDKREMRLRHRALKKLIPRIANEVGAEIEKLLIQRLQEEYPSLIRKNHQIN